MLIPVTGMPAGADTQVQYNSAGVFGGTTGIYNLAADRLTFALFVGALTGNVTGNVSGSSGSTTGNAATATALQTARTIGGISFDGTANITVATATGGFTVSGGLTTLTHTDDVAGTLKLISATPNEHSGISFWNGVAIPSANARNWLIDINHSVVGDLVLYRSTTSTGNPTTEVMHCSRTGAVSFAGIVSATFSGNLTGNVTGNADTVTTNANLAGPITSVGNTTSVASQTGTGSTFAMSVAPAFTGIPTAPTAAGGTNSTQLATTGFVTAAVATAVTGTLKFMGATDCSTNPNYPAAVKGDVYVVSVAGKIGGASGISVDVGDEYFATADNAGGTQAAVGTFWTTLEHNLEGALLSANNLSDVANAATAVNNIGGATSSGSGGLVRITGAALVTPALGAATGTSLVLSGALSWSNAGAFMYGYGGTQAFAYSGNGINYLFSGGTSLTVRNQANSADLLVLTNAGTATFSTVVVGAGLTASGGVITLTSSTSATWSVTTGTLTLNGSTGVALQYGGATKLATVTGGVEVTGNVTATANIQGPQLILRNNASIEEYLTNGTAEISVNYRGYANGTTQFRNLSIYDGKTALKFEVVGSTGAVTMAGTLSSGAITTTGTLTFDQSTDVVLTAGAATLSMGTASLAAGQATFVGATVGAPSDPYDFIRIGTTALLVAQANGQMPSSTYDAYALILRTDAGGSAPFAAAGSLMFSPRASDTAGRSTIYFNTGSLRLNRAKIDEVGDFTQNITANGAQWKAGSNSEVITLVLGGVLVSDSAANLLPANSIIDAVVARQSTAITGPTTTWQIGDPTTPARFSGAATAVATVTIIGLQHQQGSSVTDATGPVQVAAAKVRITVVGIPTAGAIRVTVFYRTFTAPTS